VRLPSFLTLDGLSKSFVLRKFREGLQVLILKSLLGQNWEVWPFLPTDTWICCGADGQCKEGDLFSVPSPRMLHFAAN
jgi:hypothetical protein